MNIRDYANLLDEKSEAARLMHGAASEIERLEALVYLPGHWKCPKCDFYLVSTNLHVHSGGFSANTEPQQCANGCGPMWRVTHEQSANTMVERCEALQTKVERLEKALRRIANGGAHSLARDPADTPLHIARKALQTERTDQ